MIRSLDGSQQRMTDDKMPPTEQRRITQWKFVIS